MYITAINNRVTVFAEWTRVSALIHSHYFLTGAKKSTKNGRSGCVTFAGKSSGPRVCTLEDALSLAKTAMS